MGKGVQKGLPAAPSNNTSSTATTMKHIVTAINEFKSLKRHQQEDWCWAAFITITTCFLLGAYGGICLAHELTVLR